jgi:RNA polymerase sigma-70 factor
MPPDTSKIENLLNESEPVLTEIYARCAENAPNFGVREDCFKASLKKTAEKYLASACPAPTSVGEVAEFLNQIQADDLFMAIACSNGNERAWWEFDRQHRSYLERVARHLAKTEFDAQEVIDSVYVELYGTRVVDGERVSKFSSYSGRGSLRGWLRTVIWHSLVDLHRAGHDEVSLDEMTENVGEGNVHAAFSEPAPGGEAEMVDEITRKRYRQATLSAIKYAFSSLDNHEKLLLLYYHVENMKLREIARLVENESSPLRGWFQRRSSSREKDPGSRIHESTIMRWLEKSYAKVLQTFRSQLLSQNNFGTDEVEICLQLATEDLAGPSLYQNLSTT